MSAHVHHHAAQEGSILWIFALPFALAAGAYLAGVAAEARRGRREWPMARTVSWMLGCATALLATLGPLVTAAFPGFAGHMTAHVLIGMVAPVLLVLGAPITLALRTLDVFPARRLSRILRSRSIRVLSTPVVAASLNLGSMAALYLTPLHALVDVPLFHLLLMAHFLLMGLLFTASIVAVDPNPHRASIRTRMVVLVLALAAHGVLAKLLVAQPIAGVALDEVIVGAQLMFYAGDVVDLGLLVLLFAEWYRVSGRRLARSAPIREERVDAASAR